MGRRNGPNAPGVAFVTGGARGLGNAVARSFAKEGARAVVIVDINNEEIMEKGKAAVEAHGAEASEVRLGSSIVKLLTASSSIVPDYPSRCHQRSRCGSRRGRSGEQVRSYRLCCQLRRHCWPSRHDCEPRRGEVAEDFGSECHGGNALHEA